jgi:hypothetical protein
MPAAHSTGHLWLEGENMIVPIGTTVSAANTGLRFTVVADLTNMHYNPTLEAYVGRISMMVPARCVRPGCVGNVAASTRFSLHRVGGNVVSGVYRMSNPHAFFNGCDEESESDFETRLAILCAAGQ